MKIIHIALSTVLLAVFASGALAIQKTAPEPEPMKKLEFPKFNEFQLKNGLELVVVEHHEQPIATVWIAVRAGGVLDPEGKSSLAAFTAAQLNKGTASKNSDDLATWIESKGGSFNASSDDDYTVISCSILSEHLATAYEFLAHVITGATFPADELEKERKRVKTALEFELSNPGAMADRHFKTVVYGHHPYAKQPTVESVEAVTREDVVAFHQRNYVANNAVMFVVGDVNAKDAKAAAEKHFGSWASGAAEKAVFPEAPSRTARNIALYHRPGSVQTNLYVGHLGLKPADPDWAKVAVANKILGGGATGRLFMIMREEKSYTYGAYSTFTKPVDTGYFRATANVRTEVSDSALTVMLDEMGRLVNEPVSDTELADAKSYLIGNFPTTIETPSQIASQVGQIKLLGLDKKYLENYRKQVAEVSSADVQAAAQKHIHPDRLAVVAVGDATEVHEKLAPIASVALYDIEGSAMSPDELSVQGTDFAYDTSSLKNLSAVYEVKVQDTMNLGDMTTTLERTTDGSFSSKTRLDGQMVAFEETVSFGKASFEPMEYSYDMTMMGQKMTASYEFKDGRATGHIESPQDGPKDVDLALVDGAFLGATVEWVIATLPLASAKTFSFPTLDTQSGAMEKIKIEVQGEEDLLVPAGTFATYKVLIKRGEGNQILYVTRDAPHVVVRQEVPAQRLSIDLKSLTM